MANYLLISGIAHQVAIQGRVVIGFRLQGEEHWTILPEPVPQAQVEIIQSPESFQRQLRLKSLSYGQKWETLSRRPDRTCTLEDGSFYFQDLPPGDYTLKATFPDRATRLQSVEQVVTVIAGENVAGKNVAGKKPPWTDLILATTGIIGEIKSASPLPSVPAQLPKSPAKSPESSEPGQADTTIQTSTRAASKAKTRAANQAETRVANQPQTNAPELEPVPQAQVQLQGGSEQTRSDRNGRFQLLDLEAPRSSDRPSSRQIELQISVAGYETQTIKSPAISRGVVQRIEVQLIRQAPHKTIP
jgi:hypothetical protein